MTLNNNQYYDKYKRNKERDRFYHSTAWRKCRDLALKRDNYLCQECLKNKRITKAVMVHHIVEVKDDFTKALVLENCVSLCNSCHEKHHDRSGKSKKKVISKKIDIITTKPNEEML